MSLHTTIKSGNIPLILLGADWGPNDSLSSSSFDTNDYPLAFPYCTNEGVPSISTAELKNISVQRTIMLWLPIPLLPLSDVPQRSLTVAWIYSSWGMQQGAKIHDPSFQVMAHHLPWRAPADWDGEYVTTEEEFFALSGVESAPNLSAYSEPQLTTIKFIQGAPSKTRNGEDMRCYLKVLLPARASGSIWNLKWQILGVAVDQW